jgi:DNA-binding GntR family transcriptional regulator
MATKLGIPQTTLRRWLRSLAAQGHELVKNHGHNERWVFSAQDAKTLMELFRSQRD